MQVHKIIVYASNESLWLLAKADNIYIDGTFRTCPRLFYHDTRILSWPAVPPDLLPPAKQVLRGVQQQKVWHPQDSVTAVGICFRAHQCGCGLWKSPYPICGAPVPHIHNQGVFLPLHTSNLAEGSESWYARGRPRWRRCQEVRPKVHRPSKSGLSELHGKVWRQIIQPFLLGWAHLIHGGHLDCLNVTHVDVYQATGPHTNNQLKGWRNRLNKIVGKLHPNLLKLISYFPARRGQHSHDHPAACYRRTEPPLQEAVCGDRQKDWDDDGVARKAVVVRKSP